MFHLKYCIIYIYIIKTKIYTIYYILYTIVYIIACYCISPQCGGADLAALQFRDLTNNATYTYIYVYIYKLPNVLYGYTLDILY
jgi:hypothetical protein